MQHLRMTHALFCLLAALPSLRAVAAMPRMEADQETRRRYTKEEHLIPMRDGIRLQTEIYIPKNQKEKLPIVLSRTPYSAGPYGKDHYKPSIGPSTLFAQENYIIAYQDVRGCFMSEGSFVDMRPHIDHKTSTQDIDESSDTYD